MIPASDTCPDGWTQEYDGYLMAEHSFTETTTSGVRQSSQYICVDGAPEVATGPLNRVEALLYFVKVRYGTLPCSKYHDDFVLSCVVCTK